PCCPLCSASSCCSHLRPRDLHSFPTRRSSDLVHIAEGLWIKCDSCKEIVYRAEVERAGRVCPKCLYPFRVSARERIALLADPGTDRKSTRLNSSHQIISYAVFCLKKKNNSQSN